MHRVLKPLKSRFIKKNASKITSCKKTILGLWIRLWSLDIATKTADTMAVWMLMWDERVESKGKLAIVGISLKWMHESDDLSFTCGPFLFWFVFVAFFKFYFIFLFFFSVIFLVWWIVISMCCIAQLNMWPFVFLASFLAHRLDDFTRNARCIFSWFEMRMVL